MEHCDDVLERCGEVKNWKEFCSKALDMERQNQFLVEGKFLKETCRGSEITENLFVHYRVVGQTKGLLVYFFLSR
jgi:hypothetical protein